MVGISVFTDQAGRDDGMPLLSALMTITSRGVFLITLLLFLRGCAWSLVEQECDRMQDLERAWKYQIWSFNALLFIGISYLILTKMHSSM